MTYQKTLIRFIRYSKDVISIPLCFHSSKKNLSLKSIIETNILDTHLLVSLFILNNHCNQQTCTKHAFAPNLNSLL